MINPPHGVKVYLATQPCDMRKGMDGLAAQVQSVLKTDPFSGALFVFRAKRGDYLKIIAWDGSGTRTARIWVALRDERPWGSSAPVAAFYAYSPDRKGIHAQNLLAPCRGYLQADAYGGFTKLYEVVPGTNAPNLTEAACWAHGRRGVYEEYVKTKSPIAHEALEKMGAMFVIEREINGKSPEDRLAVRQRRTRPLLDDLSVCPEKKVG